MQEQFIAKHIPLIEPHLRNMGVVYNVKGSMITFVLARADGRNFVVPSFASVELEQEIEKKFIELADLFEGY